ncbi:MAG: hypothetical protein ACOC33_01010 [bacterium]
MANLKQDLLNNLGNDKYYKELELARLAKEPNMNYKDKVDGMTVLLKELAGIDLAQQMIGKYFPEEQKQAPQEQVVGQPQQGQSHSE